MILRLSIMQFEEQNAKFCLQPPPIDFETQSHIKMHDG